MTKQYHDRFSNAEKELSDRSAFICESCDRTYDREEVEQAEMSCCGRTLKELLQESFGP